MPNHAHLLLRSGPGGISDLMRRLLTGYAVSFNHRHRRHGQLLQNRYKSIICQEDTYFLELVRYIHLNPVRAKLVQDLKGLNRYRFCGHSVIMGKNKRSWQQNRSVLSQFGKTVPASRKKYASFIAAGWDQGRRSELTGGGLVRSLGGWAEVKKMRLKGQDSVKGDERVLGDSAFVLSVLQEAKETLNRSYELKSQGYDLRKVEQRVMQIFGIKKEAIYSKGR